MRIKPHQKEGFLSKIRKPTIKDEDNSCFVISLKYLDTTQGQTFAEWQREELLAAAMEVLSGYCHDTLQKQCGTDSFKHYRNFPAKSDFIHPKNVPEDAEWASLHIKGKPCLAGHIVRNVFYIVFLDKDHRFYITDLKGT